MANIRGYIDGKVKKSYETKQAIYYDNDLMPLIETVCQTTVEVKGGNKTLIAGNGGSAADAQHIANKFVSKFYFNRSSLPSIALSTDTSIITASGNSTNTIEALKECQKKGIASVGLTGSSGGKMGELCDYCIRVPSNEIPRVQEAHILIGHIIYATMEESIFGKGFKNK